MNKTKISYKSTNLAWCPEIPEHWDIRKVSQSFAKIGSGTTPKSGDPKYYEAGEFNWLQTGDLNDGIINETSKKITKEALNEYSTLREYEKGSLVIAMYGATIGRCGILNVNTTTNQACCVLSNPTHFDNKFVYYWFIANRYNIIGLSYGGGQPNISQEQIRNLKIPSPPLPEQQRIAEYLDEKTGQIDQLIANKERLIECLKEERTAIINHAVTKGINPDAKLKPSGVEWIGEIPQDWEVKKLKYLVTEKLKYGANEVAESDDETQPRYIRITDIDEAGNLKKDTFKSLSVELALEFMLEEGDILFARSGATVGKTFKYSSSNGRCCFAGYLIRARLNKDITDPDFVYYFTKSGHYENWKDSVFIQATIQNIGADKYSFLEIPIPSINEQQQIVKLLKKEDRRINNTIFRIELEIDLIKEYKTALINEVVTGKKIIT